MDIIAPQAMEALEKLFELQREAEHEMLRAFYGSKPFWMHFEDEKLVVTAIEPEDFYAPGPQLPPE